MWNVVFVDTKDRSYRVHHPSSSSKKRDLRALTDSDEILYTNHHLRNRLSECLAALADITGMSVNFHEKLKAEKIPPREDGHVLATSECGYSNSDLSKVFKRSFKFTVDRYLEQNADLEVNAMNITSDDMWLSDLLMALFDENRIKSTIIEKDYLDVQRYDKLGKEPKDPSAPEKADA